MTRFATIVLAGLAALAVAMPAAAQSAGDSYVRVGAARTKLVDKGDIYTNGVLDPTADYKTRATHHGVLSFGYYPIDMVAVEGSVSSPATTDNLPAGSLAGVPNLGDDEFVLATLGASVHPFKGRVSPYVGAGMAWQITTQERDGLGVNLNIPNAHGPYVSAGIDFKVTPRFGVFAEVRKAFYHTNASGLLPLDATYTSFAEVKAKAELDPLTIQVGAVAHFGPSSNRGEAPIGVNSRKWIIRGGLTSLRLSDRAQMKVAGVPLVGEGISTREHNTVSAQIGYLFTPNLAVNATLGIPPTVDVFGAGSIGGLPKLGKVTYGPTALTAQYHFTQSGRLRPYVGAGASYMIVFGTKDGAFQDLKVKNDLSPAVEAGIDFMINDRWSVFADVKKAWLRPKTSGTFLGNDVAVRTKLDPLVFTGGVSVRF